jgi:tripartite-type tricarboxylate transporter receptor subunit TctC
MDPPPRAYDTMAKAPADGRVLGLIASDMSVHRLKGASAAGPSEVTPLAMVAHDPAAVHVRASGGWSSIAELTDDLRKRGAAAPVAAVASGAIWHLSATHWLASAKADPKALGVDVVATVDPAVEGLVDGKYDVLVCSVPEVRGLSQGKGVRTLGVMSPQRHSRYPDVPSLKEAGIAIDAGFWRGVCLPAGASAAVVASLGSAVRAAQASSEYRFALRRKGFEPRYSSGAPLKAFLDADFAAKSAILKA